jgi:hypothetical protein
MHNYLAPASTQKNNMRYMADQGAIRRSDTLFTHSKGSDMVQDTVYVMKMVLFRVFASGRMCPWDKQSGCYSRAYVCVPHAPQNPAG